jgi:hypothetical protein
VPLVWVTGNSGAGKSAVCALLKDLGELAVDADWEGCSHWVDRASGQVVADPPYPVPAGWLGRFAWRISRAEVEARAARVPGQTAFLCGSAENEADVWDLFDLVVCLVVDHETRAPVTAEGDRSPGGPGRVSDQVENPVTCSGVSRPISRREPGGSGGGSWSR